MVSGLARWWERVRDALGIGRRRGGGDAAGGVGGGEARRLHEQGDMIQLFIDGLLSHPNPDVRAGAARKLGELGVRGGRRAVEALCRALQDQDPGVRSSAALSLADLGPAAGGCVAALIEALGDADDDVRSSAGIALTDIGAAARPALQQALNHDNALVRSEASLLLRRWAEADQRPGDEG